MATLKDFVVNRGLVVNTTATVNGVDVLANDWATLQSAYANDVTTLSSALANDASTYTTLVGFINTVNGNVSNITLSYQANDAATLLSAYANDITTLNSAYANDITTLNSAHSRLFPIRQGFVQCVDIRWHVCHSSWQIPLQCLPIIVARDHQGILCLILF